MSAIPFVFTASHLVCLYLSINSKFLETKLCLRNYLPVANQFWIYSYFSQNFIIQQIIYLILQNYTPMWIFWRTGQSNREKLYYSSYLPKADKTRTLPCSVGCQPSSFTANNWVYPQSWISHYLSSSTASLQASIRGKTEQVLWGKQLRINAETAGMKKEKRMWMGSVGCRENT